LDEAVDGIEDGKDRTTSKNSPRPPTHQASEIQTSAGTQMKKQAGVMEKKLKLRNT
jgi:hypothetical protein